MGKIVVVIIVFWILPGRVTVQTELTTDGAFIGDLYPF